MNYINFSFIIPHHNIPLLLSRCIKSIPNRNDIQIIIVDDNSSLTEDEWKIISDLKNKYTEIYFTTEGKGAGYARNIGLSHAIGKWVLFADADDFFTEELNYLLDTYSNSEYDIIFFNAKSVYSDTLDDANRNLELQKFFNLNEIDNFRYSFYPPWCKMIKRNVILENSISFSETKAANDAMFSVNIGWYSKHFKLDSTIGYCVTFRHGSLEQTKSTDVIKDRIFISLEVNKFYKEHHIPRKCDLYYRHLLNLLFKNKKVFIKALKLCKSYGHSYLSLCLNMLNRILIKTLKTLANR